MAGPRADDSIPTHPSSRASTFERREAWVTEVRGNEGVTRRARSNCSPQACRGSSRLAQYPYEFIFAPGAVTINQEAWMQTRTIWTDGRAHEEDPDPTFMGDSIGHWDGDTLVVETRGIRASSRSTPAGRTRTSSC
jgi:hypothetical protein